jgi:alpha-1,6-mannosyltransferase
LVLGVALAVEGKTWIALVVAAAATAVKAPALLGVAFIAWAWSAPDVRWRDRWRPAVSAGVVTAVVLAISSWLAGFGFGWVHNLLSNGTVRSWAAPATGIGLLSADILHKLGLSVSTTTVLSITRFCGLLGAVAFTFGLLVRSQYRGWVRSLGVALLLFVELGPVVQPWYLVWGIVLLAASYKGREHFWLLLLSITGPFVGIPGGRELLAGLVHANPLLIAVAVALLGGVLVIPMGRWTQWSWPQAELERT